MSTIKVTTHTIKRKILESLERMNPSDVVQHLQFSMSQREKSILIEYALKVLVAKTVRSQQLDVEKKNWHPCHEEEDLRKRRLGNSTKEDQEELEWEKEEEETKKLGLINSRSYTGNYSISCIKGRGNSN